jgi:hypothetical protein
MSFECKFCKKSYATKGSLNNHQRTAKYCIKIQQSLSEKNSDNIEYKSFDCKYCKKTFSSNFNLNKHIKLCPSYYTALLSIKDNQIETKNNEIKELQVKIASLEQQVMTIKLETENRMLREQSERSVNTVEEIAKQPRVQQNNNQKILITSPMDLSQGKIKDMIENSFNANYMIQGQKGVARFAYDTMLKDEEGKLKYICTDPSRQIFQYKNEEGEIQKDVKAKKLTKALLDGELKSASHKIASDKMKENTEDFLEYSTYYLEIKELEDDNSDFSKELSTLVI